MCDAGRCSLKPVDNLATTSCGSGGTCFDEICQADGSCGRVAKAANTSCAAVSQLDACHTAVCDASGNCVTIALDNVACPPPADADDDLNATLCRDYKCISGRCTSIPRSAGQNCTQRTFAGDVGVICEVSLCDGQGMCVFNHTSPLCTARRSKSRTGVIAGAVAAGALVLLAVAAATIWRVMKGGADPNPYSTMFDSPAGVVSDNPTFTQPAQHSNELYS